MNLQNGRRHMPAISKMTFIWSGLLVGAVFLGLLAYVIMTYDPSTWLNDFLNRSTNPLVFAALMAVLPIFGIPVSIFLVLVGMIFGITTGILVTGGLMLFHLVATWFLVHSLFRPLVLKMLNRTQVTPPRLPQKGKKRLALIFMLIPGLPYAVKNYLLALSGLPFPHYMAISWLTQFSLSIPFIILGKGVIQMDPLILGAGLVIIIFGFAGQHYLRLHYRNLR